MAHIRMVPVDEATGSLKALYERLAYPDGRVDEGYTVLSLHPELLEANAALYRELLHGASPLTRRERELIAVTASRVNGCVRCERHHGARYAALGGEPEFPESRLDRMVAFVEKVTKEPGAVTGADVDQLRKAGFDDRAILDITAVAAYFAFANRMTLALGLSEDTAVPGEPSP